MARTATKPTAKELRRQAKADGIAGWEDMSLEELQAAVGASSEGSTSNGKSSSRVAKAKKAAGRETVKTSKAGRDNAKTTKATAAKKAAKAAEDEGDEDTGPNPFRSGTNLWHITEELMKGGKRSDMVKRLKKKITLKPRAGNAEFDLDSEMDRRVLIVGQILRNEHGFTVEREGRGTDATIVAEPPE